MFMFIEGDYEQTVPLSFAKTVCNGFAQLGGPQINNLPMIVDLFLR